MSKADARDPVPSVGIFWGVADARAAMTLVIDATPLDLAEAYGEFLTHAGGHYEVWEAWRRFGPAAPGRRSFPAAIAFGEYDDFPRGRIVFCTRERLFVIYADRKLQTPAVVARIFSLFGLAGQRTTVRSDAHYRT